MIPREPEPPSPPPTPLIKFTVLLLLRFSRENKHFPTRAEMQRPEALLARARAAVRWRWVFFFFFYPPASRSAQKADFAPPPPPPPQPPPQTRSSLTSRRLSSEGLKAGNTGFFLSTRPHFRLIREHLRTQEPDSQQRKSTLNRPHSSKHGGSLLSTVFLF